MRIAKTLDPAAPSRCRLVRCGAGAFDVPRHVVRLEGDRLAGWQVRWSTSRYFADTAFGGPDGSLGAAIKHLRRVWRPTPKNTQRNRPQTAKVAGVALVYVALRRQWYVEARHPRRGSPKRFYVGTDQTWSESRFKAAQSKAIKARRAMLAELPTPLR